jgi:hypothetical protein
MREGALHELKMLERALACRPVTAEQKRRLRPILARLHLRLRRLPRQTIRPRHGR